MLFTSDTNQSLAQLQPGDSGTGTFSFSTKTGSVLAALRNPTITATISVAGRRLNESNVPEAISSTLVRTIQVATDLSLISKAQHTGGPFKNTGPWPPESDKETTYTISWSLVNTVNSVGGASVSATLPLFVRFTGAISPSDGSLSYNDATRTVTWNAGDVPAGTGISGNARTVSFQVALLPSVSQQGTSPVLMNAPTVTGTDRFTQKQLSTVGTLLTTQTTSDPAYQASFGQVKK